MQTTIVIDDNDAADCPGSEWTANVYDENGEDLASPGMGGSRMLAVRDLLTNIEREFPNFSERF